MTIEAKIEALQSAMAANTAALVAVTEAWSKLASQAVGINSGIAAGEVNKIAAGGTVVAEVTKAPKAAKAEKPAATPPAPATVTVETPTPATAPAPTETATASPSEVEHDGSPNSITLEDIQQAIRVKASVDKAFVLATLRKYGATRGSDLPVESYQLFLDDLNEDLA